MIEMDEDEHLYSDFTDDQLRQIENILGKEVREALLVPLVVVTCWSGL
jgi:hypothetical protein